MRRSLALLTTLALWSHCAAAEPSGASRPFTVNSETSGFMVRGRLSGTVDIQDSKIVIVVESGTVLSTYRDPQKIGLRPVIAGRGIRDARRVAEAKPQSIGKFASGESRELSKPLKFRIPLPADFDPANQWLVFQFLMADGSATFVCETGNLAGAYSRQLLRPGAVCWANPDS